MDVEEVHDGARLADIRSLFDEYAAWVAVDLSFQGFSAEIANLPGDYAPPGGMLWLGLVDGVAAGCIAVRRADETACEMKRLYVRPAFQGMGCGRQLAEHAIAWARAAGYRRMLLDTLPSMAGAQRMYERLGFRDIPAYRFNPIAGTRYMELLLAEARGRTAIVGDMFQVLRAVPGDESTLRALRLQAMADAPDAFGSTPQRELGRTTTDWQRWLSTGATFILTVADEAHGVVAGLPDAADPAIVNLMSMWVHPACRGRGAADALVAAVLSWAGSAGARAVRLWVIATNASARRCYERNGFHPTGTQSVRERDGAIEVEMERTL